MSPITIILSIRLVPGGSGGLGTDVGRVAITRSHRRVRRSEETCEKVRFQVPGIGIHFTAQQTHGEENRLFDEEKNLP